MAIKAIIFDCFGVLIDSSETSLFHAFPQFKSQLVILNSQSDIGLLSKEQYINAVSYLTGVSGEELQKHDYCNVDNRDRNDSAIAWAHDIKTAGKYKVGLLSNVGRGWLNSFLKEMGKEDLFDASILSGEVSMVKPDPRIFKLMANRLGVKPDECVMIDDRPGNIAGARQAGMQGVVFASTKQAKAELSNILGE